MDYNAIIVGAGPAGASAAARFPLDFTPVIEREISRVRFRYPEGREVVAELPARPAATAMRERFDLHILNHAQAEVRDGTAVVGLRQDEGGVQVVTRSGETFRAPYLIGVDGVHSRVARLVRLRSARELGFAIAVEAPADDPLLGEGIRHAAESGRLAAEAVLTGDVKGYSRRVRQHIGANLLWGLRLARPFYRHPWGSFQLGVRNPLCVQQFLALFAGRTTYQRIVMPLPSTVARGMSRRLQAAPTRCRP